MKRLDPSPPHPSLSPQGRGGGEGCPLRLTNQQGVALLTILLLMAILTIIGMGTLTVTSLENRIAGNERAAESGLNAAESCLAASAQIIQETLKNGGIPSSLIKSSATDTTKPVYPAANLESEIFGYTGYTNVPDNDTNDGMTTTANTSSGPDGSIRLGIPPTDIYLDIDHLYVKQKTGQSLAFGEGYSTGGGAAGTEVIYQVDCLATDPTVGNQSRLVGVYSCVATGESCQRRL